MNLKTELHRVQRRLQKMVAEQRQQQASDLATETLLVLAAVAQALHKDPSDPDDRIYRRLVNARNLLGTLLYKWEQTLPPEQLNALYRRFNAQMLQAGLNPSRPGDVLSYAKKETQQ